MNRGLKVDVRWIFSVGSWHKPLIVSICSCQSETFIRLYVDLLPRNNMFLFLLSLRKLEDSSKVEPSLPSVNPHHCPSSPHIPRGFKRTLLSALPRISRCSENCCLHPVACRRPLGVLRRHGYQQGTAGGSHDRLPTCCLPVRLQLHEKPLPVRPAGQQ